MDEKEYRRSRRAVISATVVLIVFAFVLEPFAAGDTLGRMALGAQLKSPAILYWLALLTTVYTGFRFYQFSQKKIVERILDLRKARLEPDSFRYCMNLINSHQVIQYICRSNTVFADSRAALETANNALKSFLEEANFSEFERIEPIPIDMVESTASISAPFSIMVADITGFPRVAICRLSRLTIDDLTDGRHSLKGHPLTADAPMSVEVRFAMNWNGRVRYSYKATSLEGETASYSGATWFDRGPVFSPISTRKEILSWVLDPKLFELLFVYLFTGLSFLVCTYELYSSGAL